MAKHRNYEILNLIGYALAKFDNDFIKEFGFSTKNTFFEYCVQIGLANTTGVIKNRMDLFDYFFPNKRKGWWQKGGAYIHRKLWIDSLFKDEDAKGFSHIVKWFLQEQYGIQLDITPNAYLKTRYKSMQETGLEAELYFLNHYKNIEVFSCGSLKDMRLFGDGYDFYIQTNKQAFLVGVKGIREKQGALRLTQKEYDQAQTYSHDYVLVVVLNLSEKPYLLSIANPLKHLEFKACERKQKSILEYHLIGQIK
ncbi:phenylalanyl-tRNA synthetase subunit alpha [Helicobacter pylori]|uniref:DUF3883 domain-containing protein n=1 Tax=Helicobacter pylori TaxID=210 RepID=UPI0005759CCD|nr:DUF3883 domain-containing protein [Helicobacter pylori]KHL88724.1 phenylalanyl-tRNA synthetase subunit alpha [Helicobacter pylori]